MSNKTKIMMRRDDGKLVPMSRRQLRKRKVMKRLDGVLPDNCDFIDTRKGNARSKDRIRMLDDRHSVAIRYYLNLSNVLNTLEPLIEDRKQVPIAKPRSSKAKLINKLYRYLSMTRRQFLTIR